MIAKIQTFNDLIDSQNNCLPVIDSGKRLFFEHKKSPGVFPGLFEIAIFFEAN